jgi:hypothetical protein
MKRNLTMCGDRTGSTLTSLLNAFSLATIELGHAVEIQRTRFSQEARRRAKASNTGEPIDAGRAYPTCLPDGGQGPANTIAARKARGAGLVYRARFTGFARVVGQYTNFGVAFSRYRFALAVQGLGTVAVAIAVHGAIRTQIVGRVAEKTGTTILGNRAGLTKGARRLALERGLISLMAYQPLSTNIVGFTYAARTEERSAETLLTHKPFHTMPDITAGRADVPGLLTETVHADLSEPAILEI